VVSTRAVEVTRAGDVSGDVDGDGDGDGDGEYRLHNNKLSLLSRAAEVAATLLHAVAI
jgi:hypothetical protein